MTDVLLAIDPPHQEDCHAGGEDVDRDPAHDLVGSESDRNDGMDQGHRASGHDRHQRCEPDVLPSEVGDDPKEGARQHHALHGDVDHATSFGDHSPQGRQQKQHRRCECGLPQVGGEQQVKDVRDDSHLVPTSFSGGAPAVSVSVAAGAIAAGGVEDERPNAGSRTLMAPRKLAPMLKRINACSTSTKLEEMPASACMTEPPACSAPNKSDARTIPAPLPRPSSATAIASKPVVSLK